MDGFYEDNKYFPVTKETLNQPIFFEPQTKPNFSSSNPKSLYIVTSNTIIDKCILVRDLCKLFKLFQGFSSQPWQTLYSYNVGIWFPMIGNKVYQFDFSKISDKARVFWKVWAGSLLVQYQNGFESGKEVNVFSKLTILISWPPVYTPLISCHYHWNGWRPMLQQHRELWKVGGLQNYLHGEGKGQREDHFFIFRLNIVLYDSDQVDESVIETEDWKQKSQFI